MGENHPQSDSRLSSSQGQSSLTHLRQCHQTMGVALDALTNGRTMGGVAEFGSVLVLVDFNP